MDKINANGLYCAYLRKSRRDMELEAMGQGETLARHEKQLTDLAARLGIRIARTYREIVSGDTILSFSTAHAVIVFITLPGSRFSEMHRFFFTSSPALL